MKVPFKLLLRLGILVMAVGTAILGAVLVTTAFPVTVSLQTQLNAFGEEGDIRYLNVRDYELRILVPMNFTGSLSIYDYGGMQRLWDLNQDVPQMFFALTGPSIEDFRPSHRGFYLILLRSDYNDSVNLQTSFVGFSGMEPDSFNDSVLIIFCGVALSVVAGVGGWLADRRVHRLERLR